MPLDDIPCRYEMGEAIRAMANRTVVKKDGLPVRRLKAPADEGAPDTLIKFYHSIVVAVQRGRRVAQQRMDAMVKELHQTKD